MPKRRMIALISLESQKSASGHTTLAAEKTVCTGSAAVSGIVLARLHIFLSFVIFCTVRAPLLKAWGLGLRV